MISSQSSSYNSYQEVFFIFWEKYPKFELGMKRYLINELIKEYADDSGNTNQFYQKWFFFMGALSRNKQERFDIKGLKIIIGESPINYKPDPLDHINHLNLNQIVRFIMQFPEMEINKQSHRLFSSQAEKYDCEIVLDILNVRNKLAHEVRPKFSNIFDSKRIQETDLSFLKSDDEKILYKVIFACNDWMDILTKEYSL